MSSLMCFRFFFQAEDGIRDPLVTGVQTCALPIYLFGAVASFDLPAALGGESGLALLLFLLVQAGAENAHGFGAILDLRLFVLLRNDRSEERRVGKEGRTRYWR